MALSPMRGEEATTSLAIQVDKTESGTPVKLLPLKCLYTTTTTTTTTISHDDYYDDEAKDLPSRLSSSTLRVYARRPKKKLRHCHTNQKPKPKPSPSYLDSLLQRFDPVRVKEEEDVIVLSNTHHDKKKKKLKIPSQHYELHKLGIDITQQALLPDSITKTTTPVSRLRTRNHVNTNTNSSATTAAAPVESSANSKKRKASKVCPDPDATNAANLTNVSSPTKTWVELCLEDVDPITFIGFKCKVYWPLDDEWYSGTIQKYNSETYKHQVQYDDGDNESLNFSKERIKFYISSDEMHRLNLKRNFSKEDAGFDPEEMLVLAASFDDCDELEPGDIIWAKLTGHAVWPAVVVNESVVSMRKNLKPNQGERSVPVQFFGTYDFARITMKQVISFVRGLLASFHMKCKQSRFRRGLEEAKMYLSEQKLPNRMLQLQNGDDFDSGSGEDDGDNSSREDVRGDERTLYSKICPFEIGNLRVISLGKVVTDSEHFHNDQYIWPEGYAAERKFASVTDPAVEALYKMEILRDPESKFRPLFRVTMDNGDQFKGPNPSACWNKVYRRIKKMRSVAGRSSNGFHAEDGLKKWIEKSGSQMFGFSNPKVFKLIQELSYSRMPSVYSGSKLGPKRYRELTVGYRPVHVEWKDLDKCNVCHMDEEYENNLFLQCDKCRMLVHAKCYGELEPVNGVLWLCNLCRPGAPESPPPCCLCPVIGGAMKPTMTDGLWAHLACAIWIPETCLLDIKRMEPIDGVNRINKDRWKLLCSICGVSYGACIQCSNKTCRVAYHPLCARAAGLCVELEDEDRLHLISFDEDEDNQCIRLLSFCKKHRQPSNECSPGEHVERVPRSCSDYCPPLNPSGCARSEPYDFLGRRGRKEPEALAAASLKRLYVENCPYLVTGYCQNQTLENALSYNELGQSKLAPGSEKSKGSEVETSKSVLTMAEKYNFMRETFRKRLAFGKSGIHGFGIFAKHPHRAGDMVIEYTGELVRPSVADRREHFIYNSLVGAGTYMFRIDDERVIDATRAGSIAHLINHSCEPNCYSRSIKVHGDEHIIIFAKRDINSWEELTYDYRFFSIDEQLACYCGFSRCRGVVNDVEVEEHVTKLCIPRSKLVDWPPTSQQIDKLDR